MVLVNPYTWTDNAMKKGVAYANPDNADQNLQYLKWRLDNFSGGVSSMVDLGTVSADYALEADKITRVNITGNYKPTLPTPSDTSKRVTCILEFTTNNAAYPLLTSLTNLKWSSTNGGKAPNAYSLLSGVINVLIFQSFYISGVLYWQVTYTTYGAVETAFTRPNLSANGSLGGDSFAVNNTGTLEGGTAWQAFDSNTTGTFCSQYMSSTPAIIWYNPNGLKISTLYVTNYYNSDQYSVTGFTLYGSNDGSTWVSLGNYTNSVTGVNAQWSKVINSLSFYKYHKLQITSSVNNNLGIISDINFASTYLIT